MEIKNEIVKLLSSPEFFKLRQHYTQKTFFESLHINRNELVHSSFIAWLLNPSENHSLGQEPLKLFLRLLAIAAEKTLNEKCSLNGEDYKATKISFIAGNGNISDCFVQCEKSLPKDYMLKEENKNGRLDILITFKYAGEEFLLLIENKVKTSEHDSQTNLYYEWAKDQAKKFICAYLTPTSNRRYNDLTEQECVCKSFVQINYQQLLDYVIEPLQNLSMQDSTRNFIKEYERCLGKVAIDENETNKKDSFVMAFTEEERQLLVEFWQSNSAVLSAAVQALLEIDEDDGGPSPGDAEDMQKVVTTIVNRDCSKYKFLSNDDKVSTNLTQGRLVLEILKAYVATGNKTRQDIEREFGELKSNLIAPYEEAKNKTTKSGKQDIRHFIDQEDLIDLNGEKYAVFKGYVSSEIEQFIDKAHKLHLGKIEKIQK